MLTLTSLPRNFAVILVFFAGSSALAGDYPPPPQIERIRLTDDELTKQVYPDGPQRVLVDQLGEGENGGCRRGGIGLCPRCEVSSVDLRSHA